MQLHRFCLHQLFIKRLVLLFIHRTVDIVVLASAVAGGKEHLVLVKRFEGDNRRCRVKEGKVALPAQLGDVLRQMLFGQRTGGNDPCTLRQVVHPLMDHLDERMRQNALGDEVGKPFAVHRQCAACRNAGLLCSFHRQRA